MPETLHEKVKRLADLNNRLLNLFWFITQITTEQDPDTVHELVVNGLSLSTGIEKCSMYLVEPGVGLYEVAASGRVADGAFWPTTGTVELLYNLVVECSLGTGVICLPFPDPACSSSVLVCPLKNSNREVRGILCGFTADHYEISNDYRLMLDLYAKQVSVILENHELNRKLRKYAFIDPLTGLYNRRHFFKRLRGELNRGGRRNRPVTLLMLDVDNFKQYNDNFGHIAGDRALRQLGLLLKNSVREMDMAVRYGGEEFAIILPETDLAGGSTVAEHLCGAIETTEFAGRHITVSIGLATFPDQAADAHQLIKTADEALYAAKRLGRNRVSTIDTPPPLHSHGE